MWSVSEWGTGIAVLRYKVWSGIASVVLRRTASENWNWYCTAGRSFETFAEQQLGPVTDAQVCKDQEEDGSYDDHDEDGHDDEVDMAMMTYLASKLSAVFFAKLPQVVWMLGGRPPVHRRHQIVISSMFATIESPLAFIIRYCHHHQDNILIRYHHPGIILIRYHHNHNCHN